MTDTTSGTTKRSRKRTTAPASGTRRVIPRRANGQAHKGLLERIHPAWLVAGGLIAAGLVARVVVSRGLLGGLGLAAAASGLLAQIKDTDWAGEVKSLAERVGAKS